VPSPDGRPALALRRCAPAAPATFPTFPPFLPDRVIPTRRVPGRLRAVVHRRLSDQLELRPLVQPSLPPKRSVSALALPCSPPSDWGGASFGCCHRWEARCSWQTVVTQTRTLAAMTVPALVDDDARDIFTMQVYPARPHVNRSDRSDLFTMQGIPRATLRDPT
jgi:hypothetical protein